MITRLYVIDLCPREVLKDWERDVFSTHVVMFNFYARREG